MRGNDCPKFPLQRTAHFPKISASPVIFLVAACNSPLSYFGEISLCDASKYMTCASVTVNECD